MSFRLFRSFTAAVLSFSLALSPLVAFADSTDTEAQRLEASKKAERYSVAIPGASIKAGGAAIYVSAPMSVVRKVVTDYAHYGDFMPRFQQSRVIAKKAGQTDVYLQVPILNGAATVWATTRFAAPVAEGTNGERIEGKMIDGNVSDLRAIWHLRQIDESHTVLKLELLIVPKLPLPGGAVTQELEYASDQGVTSAKARAEAKVAASSEGSADAR